MTNIRLDKLDFFETNAIPKEGDVVFVGCRRELVVADVPEAGEHGHLIRTAYKNKDGRCIESTYLVDGQERKDHTLTALGSEQGVRTKELYSKRLSEAGF